jgi:hypothetical protein
MSKKLYVPVAARRAADEALVNLTKQYAAKSEYVAFDNGKSVRRRIKSFDAYFYGNHA